MRGSAAMWSIDPHKIGAMGFSAGGQLAVLAATRFDAGDKADSDSTGRQNSRPDFVALVYPGAWPELKFPADTSPTSLQCGGDDRPEVVTGIKQIYLALHDLKAPAELHIYDRDGHGLGLRVGNSGPVAAWPPAGAFTRRGARCLTGTGS